LFNFGSEKSGDELYITVLTEDPAFPGDITNAIRETVILTGDPDLHEMNYTITAPSGNTFIGVEFLAGNESSFKLGIESISSISYNTDFDMQLGYDITDSDGDSDSGTVTISLDGDETILYDATKSAIDAGDEQFGGGGDDDVLVLDTGVSIDFDDSITAPELSNFEIFDLTQNGAHALTNISVQDVTDMTDSGNALAINADVGDSVQLTTEWQQIGATDVYEDIATQTINITVSGVVPTLTSIIVDAPIIGMSYETSSGLSGVTNDTGNFSYIFGDSVTFKLGGIELGAFDTNKMNEDGQLFLQDLAGVDRTDLSDPHVVNLAILLQSIDENGIADDGLTITESIQDAFSKDHLSLDSMTTKQVIELVESAGFDAVSPEAAMEHVQNQLIERTELKLDDFKPQDDASVEYLSDFGSELVQLTFSEPQKSTVTEKADGSSVAPSEPLDLRDVLHKTDSEDELLSSLPTEKHGAETDSLTSTELPVNQLPHADLTEVLTTDMDIVKAMTDSNALTDH
ncbi:MAG: hypothetical protein OET90_07670, partial [Desulfuromonadales bacterium]|nr:hypothetical protein [Desulfuromonadales bacterium]